MFECHEQLHSVAPRVCRNSRTKMPSGSAAALPLPCITSPFGDPTPSPLQPKVPELLAGLSGTRTAILYYEQGHEFLFGDPVRTQPSFGYAAVDRTFHMAMGLPVALACVSEPVRQVLQQEFGRGKVLVVPNGVDTDAFTPRIAPTPDAGHRLDQELVHKPPLERQQASEAYGQVDPQGGTSGASLGVQGAGAAHGPRYALQQLELGAEVQQEQGTQSAPQQGPIKAQTSSARAQERVLVEARACPDISQAMDTDSAAGGATQGVHRQRLPGVEAGSEVQSAWTDAGLPPPTCVISTLKVRAKGNMCKHGSSRSGRYFRGQPDSQVCLTGSTALCFMAPPACCLALPARCVAAFYGASQSSSSLMCRCGASRTKHWPSLHN